MSNPTEGLYLNVHVRRDVFGRIVLDECESDSAHLRFAEAPPGDDRPRCRQLLEELFADLVGRHGTLSVDIFFEDKARPE